MDTVIKEVVVDAEPDEVFTSVIEQIDEWAEQPDGTTRPSVVEKVEAPNEIVFWWMDDDPSRVDITIEPVPDGSLVRIVEQRVAISASALV